MRDVAIAAVATAARVPWPTTTVIRVILSEQMFDHLADRV